MGDSLKICPWDACWVGAHLELRIEREAEACRKADRTQCLVEGIGVGVSGLGFNVEG